MHGTLTAEPRIKGAALIPLLTWYERRFGRARLEAVLRALPPAQAAYFDPREAQGGLLSSIWYPQAPVHAVLEGMLAGLAPAEQGSLAREAGRAVIETTLNGIYRFLFQAMLTPDRYARHAQRLFEHFYDRGRLETEIVGPRHHRTRVVGWASHHRLICAAHLATIEYIYEALGCRGVRATRLACVDEGAPCCQFEITWQE